VPKARPTRLHHSLQAHRLPSEFLTNGAAEKRVMMKHTNLRHVARIVANDDLFSHVGSQRQIDVAKTAEVNTILVHLPGRCDREKQQIQFLQTLRQLRQEAACFPTRLWFHVRLPVFAPQVIRDQEGVQTVLELRQGEGWRRLGHLGRRIPRLITQK
jgi:hypothetical protein